MERNNRLARKILLLLTLFSIFPFLGLNSSVSAHDEELIDVTNQLIKGASDYHRAEGPGRRAATLARLTAIAQVRKALLLEKLQSDPGEFLLHALPEAARKNIPLEVQSLIEEQITTEGELTVIQVDDFENERFPIIEQLEASDGKRYTLHLTHGTTGLMTGSKIKVKGVRLESELALAGGDSGSGGSGSSLEVLSAAEAVVSGDQHVIVIIGNFLDSSVSCSATTIYTNMFTSTGSVNNYYQESSFGNVRFSGDVYGPYTINYYASSGDYTGWANALDQAATASGANLANYNRRLYIVPPNGTGYGGLAYVGGSRAWVFYCTYHSLLGHELGHNLGMRHSAKVGGSEYDDRSCVMGGNTVSGSAGLRHVNAPHKTEMGWVPASRVQTVTASGNYRIAMLETPSSEVQALKISKPDTNEYYYIGYRRPVAFDAAGLKLEYQDRTSVHRWGGISATFTYLVSSLSDGLSFTDSVNGVTVTQTSHDDTHANVSVTLTTPPCAPATPTVTVSPASQTASAGKTMSYTVTVTNKDSTYCAATLFGFTATIPLGWSSGFSPSSITLNPGQSGSVTCTVTSATTTADGTYPISVKAADLSDASHTALASATAVVFTDLTVPTVDIMSPTDGSTVSGTVAVKASASDNVGVSKVEFYVDGALKSTDTSAPYEYSWNTNKMSGSHAISSKAHDTAGNTSTMDSVNVTVSGGNTGLGRGRKK